MEVRDPVHGSIEITQAELKVIDSPLFQRLRNIKQMGFSDLAFPGATHSRYIHSIGAMLLAGQAFDSIFRRHEFKRPGLARQFRELVRIAALLHDVGHAPLSHCTEFAMPTVGALRIPCYHGATVETRRATHEDYTIKILTDSGLAEVVRKQFPDFSPTHVAALVEQALPVDDDFFVDGGVNYRTVLAQIISSELDVDRMDYLRRDSYNAGVSYGNYDFNWIFTNLTFHVTEAGNAHLAIDPRAIYAFNDFLIARYHMFLQVYFHHKSVIFEEMLKKYFQSPDARYVIAADIDEYVEVDDYQLYYVLRQEARAGHPWAKRLMTRDAYKLLHEMHGRPEEIDLTACVQALQAEDIPLIATSSTGDLSKYTKPGEKRRRGSAIYATVKEPDPLQRRARVRLLEECTDLFVKYEEQRQISRIYVPREEMERARQVLATVNGP